MIPFVDDPRWNTFSARIREMQEKQRIDNELYRHRCYINALERGDVVFPKNSKECENVHLTSSMFLDCSYCNEECY